jgi:hypothetical protein
MQEAEENRRELRTVLQPERYTIPWLNTANLPFLGEFPFAINLLLPIFQRG